MRCELMMVVTPTRMNTNEDNQGALLELVMERVNSKIEKLLKNLQIIQLTQKTVLQYEGILVMNSLVEIMHKVSFNICIGSAMRIKKPKGLSIPGPKK